MRRQISARAFQTLLLILTISLASCGPSETMAPAAVIVPRVKTVLSKPTPAERRAEIRRQLAPVCATPLTDDELERAAQFVEENRGKGAVWIAGRLLRMHRETKRCRGQ